MKNYYLKNSGQNLSGQSILEYAILFAMAVSILVFAINGPVRNSLTTVFTNLIDDIQASVGSLTS